jgi:TonB family protein
MERPAPSLDTAAEEVDLFPAWRSRESAERAWRAKAVSLGLHAAVLALLVFTPLGRGTAPDMGRVVLQLHEPIRLTAPPRELTQTTPNRGKVGKEFDLQSLLPRRDFVPPSMPPGAPPMGLPEPPRINLGQAGVPALPPPVIQAEEKPKLAFELPTAPRTPAAAKPLGAAKLLQPGPSITEMRTGAARGTGGGMVLEDIPLTLSGPGMDILSPPSGIGSSLEMLSDPKGVDFKPYLIQILASVKRNWQSVIPESARLGRRGRVVIQFAINRDGSVPKLVIATPSGADALDRAAVAGISATNPFPPLPSDFTGENIRLQFVFLYNVRP